MVEALAACEPDMLQVSNISHTVDTDQRVLGQLSDLYDRELVGIIGTYQLSERERERDTREVINNDLFTDRASRRLGQADSGIRRSSAE